MNLRGRVMPQHPGIQLAPLVDVSFAAHLLPHDLECCAQRKRARRQNSEGERGEGKNGADWRRDR